MIKVEAPEGDMTRILPPHFIGTDSAYYLSVNRNKYSIVIDIKTPAGKALVRELVLASDIVVENFRPGVPKRLGIAYDSFVEEKPQLIWCSVSGFGQDGPYKDRPAYDMIVQAMSGGMSLTGEPDGHSVRSGVPLGDLSAGMYGVIGVLAALHEQQNTGKGQHVDVAMLDCQISMLSYQAAYYLTSGAVPGRQGRGHDSIPTYRSFTCGDGSDVVITANTERMWQSLCDVIGQSQLVDDPRFRLIDMRYQNRKELWSLIETELSTAPADQWVEKLLAAGIPAAVVATLDRSLSDPQVVHRNMVLEMIAPGGEKLRVPGNPVKFLNEEISECRYPPALGADEDLVLREVVGISQERIRELRSAGVIGPKRQSNQSTVTKPLGAA